MHWYGNRGKMYKTVQINCFRKVFCVTAYPCVSTSVLLTSVWAASCFCPTLIFRKVYVIYLTPKAKGMIFGASIPSRNLTSLKELQNLLQQMADSISGSPAPWPRNLSFLMRHYPAAQLATSIDFYPKAVSKSIEALLWHTSKLDSSTGNVHLCFGCLR